MNCHFLLLLLPNLPHVWSSVIALLLYRSGLYKRPTIVSLSVIITERHLIGTQYPAALYPTRRMCAMVDPVHNYPLGEPDMWTNCFELKHIFPLADDSPINFAVFSLLRPITFLYGVSRAQIIPPHLRYTSRNCTVPCSVYQWHKPPTPRRTTVQTSKRPPHPGYGLDGIYVILYSDQLMNDKPVSEENLYINLTAEVTDDYMNPTVNGQPMYCQYMVAGVVDVYPHPIKCDRMNLEGCIKMTKIHPNPGIHTLRFINLQHKTIRSMIDRIPRLP